MTVYSKTNAQIVKLEKEYQELEQTYLQNKAVVDNLPEFKRELTKTELKLKEALTRLPDKKDLPQFMKSVSQILTDSGLASNSFKPLKEQNEQFYARVPVDLKLVGTYHNLAMFCDRVSRLPRIVNVSNLNLTAGSGSKVDTQGETFLRISCRLETFRFLEEQAFVEPEDEDTGKGKKGKKKKKGKKSKKKK